MCPLRLILIFLSATLAGFFVLRNLKSVPKLDTPHHEEHETNHHHQNPNNSPNRFSKVPNPFSPLILIQVSFLSSGFFSVWTIWLFYVFAGSVSHGIRVLDHCGHGQWTLSLEAFCLSAPKTIKLIFFGALAVAYNSTHVQVWDWLWWRIISCCYLLVTKVHFGKKRIQDVILDPNVVCSLKMAL